jgi:TolB protein
MAARYGWERLPARSNWRTFFPGIRFNQFVIRGGLDWNGDDTKALQTDLDGLHEYPDIHSGTDAPRVHHHPYPPTPLPTDTPTPHDPANPALAPTGSQ